MDGAIAVMQQHSSHARFIQRASIFVQIVNVAEQIFAKPHLSVLSKGKCNPRYQSARGRASQRTGKDRLYFIRAGGRAMENSRLGSGGSREHGGAFLGCSRLLFLNA